MGGHGRARDQREQHGQDSGAEAAGRQGAGRGGQEGVRDASPGPQQPRGEQRAGDEVRGESGERNRADQQQRECEAGGAEEQRGQGRDHGQVGRGGLGAAGADGVPAVRVAAPQVGDVAGSGQQGAAGQGAAAEEAAAGDEGDQEQDGEEHRAGLAADALQPGELVDLQEVGVVAARAGLDGAVPRAAGLGLRAAAEVAGDLFDGRPDGGAGCGEEPAHLGRIDDSLAAGAPCAEDAAGAQQGAEEAGDLVERLARHLADEVGERTQQRAEQEPEQDPGQPFAGGVDQHGVDGAGLVDAVRAGDRAAGAVDGPAFAGGRLGVPQDGVGGDQHPVPGHVGAPAQVDVVTHQGQPAVEAAELLPDVPADQHARGGDGQDGTDLVVLALVLLAPVESGPAASAVGDRDADFEELAAVVPAAELGSDDRGVLVVVDDAEHLGEGVGFGGAVVVEQPEPLHRFAVRQFGQVVGVVAPGPGDGVPAAGALQVRQVVRGEDAGGAARLVDGGAEARTPREVQDAVGAERLGDQARGVVGAAGVGGDDVLYGAFLAEQPGERVGQPACAVVGDEHGGDDMPGELWGGGGRVRRRCLAVHGHRGTGPPAGSGGCPPGAASVYTRALSGRWRVSDGAPH